MQQEQLDGLKTDLKVDFKDILDLTLKVGVIDALSKIDKQTEEPKLVQATEKGICNSLNSPSCNISPNNPAQTNGLKGLKDKLQSKLDELNVGLGLANLGANQNIIGIVKNTNEAVRHTSYGLEAVQNFASKAWKATRLGKILEYLSLAATIHNAAMLSRNVGGSLGDVVSAIGNNTISLIKNEEFQEININETLGTSIEDFLKRLIGTENYTGVSQTLTKYNRIVNSASNVIYSVTSIQAGLAQGLETIGNYTGRVGNALKKSGAVLEDSYTWMSENVSVKTGRLGQIQRVIDGAETVENVASDIQNATEELREAQENVTNIGNQYEKVKQEFTDQETEKTETENTTKTNSQGAQPTLTDFVRDPLEN